MKKISLGIAIILLSILLEFSTNLGGICWLIGGIGMIFAIAGFISGENP